MTTLSPVKKEEERFMALPLVDRRGWSTGVTVREARTFSQPFLS
jgi:hypothetical protein